MTDKAKFLNKKIWWPQFEPTDLNQTHNDVFRHFLEFGSYVFLKIANDNSLQQCLTFSGGKTQEKNFWFLIWDKWPEIGPKLGFLPFLTKFGSLVFLDSALDCSLGQGLYHLRKLNVFSNLMSSSAQSNLLAFTLIYFDLKCKRVAASVEIV